VPAIEKHAVRELFARPRTDVRIAAYQALGRMRTPHARRLLNQALSDKDPEVKAAAKGLLRIR
jgi:HEAT repeat protein